ncbi:MAG: EAL domain-containing protein [Rhizobiaceae bacterium]|nr:EAL domain-containing protein [Rhizobiaceae bacterium]
MALFIMSVQPSQSWLGWAAAGFIFVLLAAVLLAVRTFHARVGRLSSDLDTLSRAMDKAVRDLAQRSNRDATTMAELKDQIARELASARAAAQTRQPAGPVSNAELELDAEGGNVVVYEQAKLARKAREARPARSGEAGGLDAEPLVRQALATQTLELSLRPIISVARGAAAGFDVFAHFEVDGRGIDLAANAAEIPEGQRAAYECLLVDEAIGTARRRLGSVSQSMPLHISVSPAFLGEAGAVGKLVAAARAHEPLAAALVVCVPAILARKDDAVFPALQRIAEAGIRIALEDWAPRGDIALPATLQVAFLKVQGRRLVEEAEGTDVAGRSLAAGALVIAVDVASDDEAMALIDEGINLMSGPRFSAPRRLRPDDEGAIERMSRISV